MAKKNDGAEVTELEVTEQTGTELETAENAETGESGGSWRDKPIGVELADGTMLNASAGYAGGSLWIWVESDSEDNNVPYLAGLFSDPEKTKKIISHGPGGVEQEWEGMTKLITILVDDDGKISLRMRRG